MSKKNIALIIVLAVLLPIAAIRFVMPNSNLNNLVAPTKSDTEITLEFWGLWDNSDAWQTAIERFQQKTHHWNGQDIKVKINYTKKDIASYEAELEKAYQEDKSPAVFMISNYWLKRYASSSKLEPLPGNKAYAEEYGLLKYEEAAEIFPHYALQDAYYGDNNMYAMPIYSDSLALYYNKELFQKAGIDNPPVTWDELKSVVKKLTVLNKDGSIKQSGIALGGGKNVNRSSDILSLLAFQGGSKMISAEKNIEFNKKVRVNTPEGPIEREPGMTAVQFYMDFSDPDKQTYSWNGTFTDSVQDFAEGKTAMMFGYSYQRANLLALKPELNYGIAPAPQMSDSTPMNISNIWFPVVSNQNACSVSRGEVKNLDCTKIAWSFLSFANEKENIASYLNTTNKASARIDLSQEQVGIGNSISAFAKQVSMARSYEKFNDRIDSILVEMLDEIAADRENWRNKADEAAAKIEEFKK